MPWYCCRCPAQASTSREIGWDHAGTDPHAKTRYTPMVTYPTGNLERIHYPLVTIKKNSTAKSLHMGKPPFAGDFFCHGSFDYPRLIDTIPLCFPVKSSSSPGCRNEIGPRRCNFWPKAWRHISSEPPDWTPISAMLRLLLPWQNRPKCSS